jgi:two-component system sensor histidine kinase ChvG
VAGWQSMPPAARGRTDLAIETDTNPADQRGAGARLKPLLAGVRSAQSVIRRWFETGSGRPIRLVAQGALSIAQRYGRRAQRGIRATHDRVAAAIWPWVAPVARVLGKTLIIRFISRTLLRRIVASNLLGLLILLMGLTYLIQFNSWLIDAKIEHLRAQSHIIAAAIASKATLVENGAGGGDESARQSGPYDPLQSDPFAAIEFSIQPEVVVPLLPSLLRGTENRARVYDKSLTLIADSSRILTSGNIIPIRRNGRLSDRKPKTKNIFTHVTQWMMGSDLAVYKEIKDANGRAYPEVREALAGRASALMMLASKRQKIVSVAMPIEQGDEVRGVLLLSTAPGEIDDVQADELFAVLLMVFGATTAALIASYLLARTVAEPVRQLSKHANEVTRDIQAAQDLPRFDDRDDEVGQLARSFALMTKALYRRIEASEKFAADVAHELKNPLTAARSTAESLIYAKTDEQRDELIEQIQIELKRLNRLISDVSNASRLDAELALQRFDPVELMRVAQNLVETFRDMHAGEMKNVTLEIEGDGTGRAGSDTFMIQGQEGRIAQVFTNLLSNAMSFTPRGGSVHMTLRRRGDAIEAIVSDEGPGIAPDAVEKIFERFYTYRPTTEASRGENSGLGLAISREILEAHGGQIWAENVAFADGEASNPRIDAAGVAIYGAGARFVVRLPAAGATRRGGRLDGGRA